MTFAHFRGLSASVATIGLAFTPTTAELYLRIGSAGLGCIIGAVTLYRMFKKKKD